jgi:cytoskeleton protein RodZ
MNGAPKLGGKVQSVRTQRKNQHAGRSKAESSEKTVSSETTAKEPRIAVVPPSVGASLRAAREASRQSIDDIAAALCMRPDHIAALEEDDTSRLPGCAYACGFVRCYAKHLGLDGEALLARFKEETPGGVNHAPLVFPEAMDEARAPAGSMLAIGAVMALMVYGVWYFTSGGRTSVADGIEAAPARLAAVLTEEKTAPAPPLARADAASALQRQAPLVSGVESANITPRVRPQALAQPVASQGSATTQDSATTQGGVAASSATPAPAVEASRILLRARTDTWVRIKGMNNDELLLDGILPAGAVFRAPNRDDLVISTGDAGALEITVDGQPVAAIGPAGAVRREVPLTPEHFLARADLTGR